MPFGFAAPEWRAKSPLRARDQVVASRQARFLFQLQLLARQTPELKLLLLLLRLQTPTRLTAASLGASCACLRRLCGRVIKFSGMPKTQFEVIKWQLLPLPLPLPLLSLTVMMECVRDDETTKLRLKNYPPSLTWFRCRFQVSYTKYRQFN